MIEFGIVTSVNYKNSTANVTIEGMEDYTLEDITVMQELSGKNKSFIMPDVGTSVIVGFSEDRRAVILGCKFSEVNQSPSDSNKFIKSFSDGTIIEYDIEKSKLTANIKGTASVSFDGNMEITSSSNVTIKAKKITLDGAVETTGKIQAGTDVTAMGVSLVNHTHTGNMGSPTSIPIKGGD